MHNSRIPYLLVSCLISIGIWNCGDTTSGADDIENPVSSSELSSSSEAESSETISSPESSSEPVSSSQEASSSSTVPSSSSRPVINLTDDDFVNVGGQLWTKKNLNIEIEGSRCYEDKPENCEKYGRLYTWAMAMDVDLSYNANQLGEIDLPYQGICPEGTHLPSHEEWTWLYEYVRANPEAAKVFTNQVGGFYDHFSGYKNEDIESVFWSSTEYDVSNDRLNGSAIGYNYAWLWAYRKDLSVGKDNARKTSAAHVRCIKDGSEGVLSSSSIESSSSFVYEPDADSIRIGDQVWMTKNLDSIVEGSFCFDNNEENCEKYGRLYTWSQAMGVDSMFDNERLGPLYIPYQGICPEGAHLPTNSELQTLAANLKKYPEYMAYFTNQLGGFFNYKKEFTALEEQNIVWSSTEYNATGTGYTFMFAWLHAFRKDLSIGSDNPKKITGAYVRCIKGAAAQPPKKSDSITLEKAPGCETAERSNWKYLNPSIDYGCIKDNRDGRFYKTVVIGDRVWLAENLRYKPQKSSWCYNEADSECDEFGRYYSGYAVSESPSICPEGFHIPKESEALQLRFYITSSLMSVEGWKKAANTFIGNNSTGFTLLPAGIRGYANGNGWVTGEYDGVGNVARFWSSAPYNGTGYYEYVFMNTEGGLSMTDKEKGFGMPVRCIKDSE